MYKSFTEMPVWENALTLSVETFLLTANLPKSEDYSLTSQIRSSARSVSANISEAFGRKTKKDKCNFYVIARGSAYETQNHLIYGNKVGYFEKENIEQLYIDYNKLVHEINKIIKSLSI